MLKSSKIRRVKILKGTALSQTLNKMFKEQDEMEHLTAFLKEKVFFKIEMDSKEIPKDDSKYLLPPQVLVLLGLVQDPRHDPLPPHVLELPELVHEHWLVFPSPTSNC